MDAALFVAVGIYALVAVTGMALLRAAYRVPALQIPEGFSRAGWIDVATEINLDVPPEDVVGYVSGATQNWALVSTEQLDERVRPGKLIGGVIREDEKAVIVRQDDSVYQKRSRFEVSPAGRNRCLVRWFAQYQKPHGIRSVILDIFVQRGHLERAMASSLRKISTLGASSADQETD